MVLNRQIDFPVTPQPDESTCGPACLHAIYNYYGDRMPLATLIGEVDQLPTGGTLAVFLALHAMRRGYDATIYTCDLHTFDPTWFKPGAPPLCDRLLAQAKVKHEPKLQLATHAYLEYLQRGGRLLMEDIGSGLLRRIIARGTPIIAGLSATWLYRCPRDRQADMKPDDVAGEPTGHFVVIHGLDTATRQATVADPYLQMPHPGSHAYTVKLHRLIGAIMLGVVTYDAKLLILHPRGQ